MLNNVPATVRIITKDQIRKNAYFTLEDVLADLPGFQFRNILGLNSYSFLRGLPRQNNSILILIDGIQINELNSGGFYGGGQYNLCNVESIEVYYGPASVLYGTNALSGVINIITKSPEQGTISEANMGIGNFATYQSDISYAHKGQKIDFQFSAMYKSSEKADLTGSNNDYLWDDNLQLFEKDYALDAKLLFGSITGGINYQNRQSSTSTHYPSVGTVHKGYGTLWNLQLFNAYLKHRKYISENLLWHTTLYNRNATILGNSVKVVTDTGQIAHYRPNNQTGIESLVELKINNIVELVAGIFGYYEVLASGYSKSYSSEYFITPQKPVAPEFTDNLLFGMFLETDIRLSKNWQLSPGIHMEYNTAYKQVFTPNASLLYNNKKITSKIIYARAFRAPKPWDFTDGEGNKDLQPEYLNSFEFANIFFLSDYFKTEINIYNNLLSNGIAKEFNEGQTSYKWVNVAKTNTKGIEFGVVLQRNNLGVDAFYSYTDSRSGENEFVDEIAMHSGLFSANYSFSEHLNVGVKMFYFGKRKNPKIIQATQSEFIEPALVTNLYINLYSLNNLNIQLIGKNITNAEYYHTSNLTPDRFRQPQLSFFLKFSYLFYSNEK
jgi:outer membrane cobalamin receptor